MFIHKLELVNFRNYEHCKIEFQTNKTILVGKNAQGKTNLIESIYYLAVLSSYRASGDSELIKKGESSAVIKAMVEKSFTNVNLDIIINPPKHKLLKVNSIKKSGYSQFLGNLIVVNFSISDLLLLRGSPSDRRKWIDDSISQLYPAYIDRLHKYNKIRVQRNNLLKEFKGNINLTQSQKDSLFVWNEQIIKSGSNLIHLRMKYLKEIQSRACEKHKFISFGEENLLVKYNSTITGDFDCVEDEIMPPEKIAELYSINISQKQAEEIIRSQTVTGPHRDDILFFINGINAKNFASQGQQRTIVLALKLAELDFIKSITDENPVLLLDDVLAELDQSRQNYLLDSIGENIQTIITTVDISNFPPEYLEGVTIYNVESGKIKGI
ncbi:MAG: DNA replication/repair protein RecF [Candidatus Gastranaerophilales bacterium]|nr:DNA replication/repair protein RecF [Candidatus Gastranaerophilales bacterium]